jgi:protein-disulfide isomerase
MAVRGTRAPGPGPPATPICARMDGRPPARRRRPPLSGKQSTPQTSRRERRAAERRDRFDVARDERRSRGTGSGGPSLLTTRNITVASVVVGVLIVALIAINQLGDKVTGTLQDPGISYPAAIQDGEALGSADAPMTLDVYSDYQCPYCAQSVLSVEPLLVNQYVEPGTLRIVHHEVQWVSSGANSESQTAMAGAYCAIQQGKYWPYTVWVYNNQDGENQGGFRPARLTTIAEAAGLDLSTWTPCLTDQATIQAVNATSQEDLPKLSNGTPTFYLDGQPEGSGVKSFAQWSPILDAELAGLTASPAASAAASPSTAP